MGGTGTLVGRHREMAKFRSVLRAVPTGRGGLILCRGDAGIGKSRLLQEFAGAALATGSTVAWGRCVDADGAPAYWPWVQVLDSLGVDSQELLASHFESPTDRFRMLDEIADAVLTRADPHPVVMVLDDLHWADDGSLVVLRHLSGRLADSKVLVVGAFRGDEPHSRLGSVLQDLLRTVGVELLALMSFDLNEVREYLGIHGASAADAATILDATEGNPLFVREVTRDIVDGTWTADRPPTSVVELAQGRLSRLTPACRGLIQAASILGREFSLELVAAMTRQAPSEALPYLDEAIAYGLVDTVGASGNYRFVHALIRDAVLSSLARAERAGLHRLAAEAIERKFPTTLTEHVDDLARHWKQLVPLGEGARARTWLVRAAEEATRRLAYGDAARLYAEAHAIGDPALDDADRAQLAIELGRARHHAGDLGGAAHAIGLAAEAARACRNSVLLGEAALVLEAVPDPELNAFTQRLSSEALKLLEATDREPSMRARLLAQLSHLAFYRGEVTEVEALSAAALALARTPDGGPALVDALRARQEGCAGPSGRPERLQLADEMESESTRTDDPRPAMWGQLWRIDALLELGQLARAAEECSALRHTISRVGGPVSAWHLDRTEACVALAQGRYAIALEVGQRAFGRMQPIEPSAAAGGWFALLCALSSHIGVTEAATPFLENDFQPPPRFTTMAPVARSYLLLRAGLTSRAEASLRQAGPARTWVLPEFFALTGYSFGVMAAAELGRTDELAALVERLQPHRGEFVVASGVAFLGPVELALGRAAAALGAFDRAIEDLTTAVHQARLAQAPGFQAEAAYHLACALHARGEPGDTLLALDAARTADGLAQTLGMSAYEERITALLGRLHDGGMVTRLSVRESEVAALVAQGLTNKQIGEHLFISTRTAQNHVQHILSKLGFSTRSQIAAWSMRHPE